MVVRPSRTRSGKVYDGCPASLSGTNASESSSKKSVTMIRPPSPTSALRSPPVGTPIS
ncbi:Hypothetical protein FKW44_024359 [Caligus rogercresseyi]|uniref:Uncharacterized protein n=1 Tax=Caligus rogercresseyi TaxID=217165 RepID=A0A7T8GM23_CALRO|nr:Hypothetical protein FKW44_024768 [Caligus rogercresseyi]QQP33107.1 Hypothetical protein FKW44_024359 [Caligus rogercresseyi]